jgi:hypothetical protein
MMELPMAPLHPYLKPAVSLEQGNQFLDLHADSLPRAPHRGITTKVTGRAQVTLHFKIGSFAHSGAPICSASGF